MAHRCQHLWSVLLLPEAVSRSMVLLQLRSVLMSLTINYSRSCGCLWSVRQADVIEVSLCHAVVEGHIDVSGLPCH